MSENEIEDAFYTDLEFGTEPKIKIYTSVTGTSCEDAEIKTNHLTKII